jgi:peptide/nickel transport system substrate-binding protein
VLSSAGYADIAPLVVEMLQAGGFDVWFPFGVDAYQHIRAGQPGLYLYGHGASLTDPYATLALYHSRYSRPTTQPASDGDWSRYTNPFYDQLLDDMAPWSSDERFRAQRAPCAYDRAVLV